MTPALQDVPPFTGHSPQEERALGGYASLMTIYSSVVGAFVAWFRSGGRTLPESVRAADLALMTVATHKAARIITKDRVGSTLRAPFTEFQENSGQGEVDEKARGRGLRRALGELLVCPYCIGVWIATALTAGLLVAPRATRQVMSILTAVFGADLLQIAYVKAEDLVGS